MALPAITLEIGGVAEVVTITANAALVASSCAAAAPMDAVEVTWDSAHTLLKISADSKA